ncbi:MAG: GxxExxY protein [Planctomycetota bacterium]
MNRQDAKSAKDAKRKEPDKETDALAYAVIGAAIEVHRLLGPGYLESMYEEALCLELSLRNIPFVRQVSLPVEYKGQQIGEGRCDLLVGDVLIVELKTVEALAPVHTAQVLSYLKATRKHLGLLVNFNVPVLKEGIKRVVLS